MNSAEIWLLIKYTAVFLFLYLISGTVVSWIWPQKNQKKYKSLPGPYFVVWLLNYLKNKFFGDANKINATSRDLILKYFDTYGDIYAVNFLGRKLIFVADPKVSKHVLTSDINSYAKVSDESGVLQDLAKDSVLMSEGAAWKRHRDIVSRAFASGNIIEMFPIISTVTQKWIEKNWISKAKNNSSFDVEAHKELTKLTFSIITNCAFNMDVDHDSTDSFAADFQFILNELESPWRRFVPFWQLFPVRSNRLLNKAFKNLNNLVQEIIGKRRDENARESAMRIQQNGIKKDLLHHLMTAETDYGALNEKELKDNIMTFLLAGHETSANFLAFTLYFIAANPAVQKRIREELKSVKFPLTYHDLQQLELVGNVIKESLRLYPPAPMIARTALADDELPGDYFIAKDSMVLISMYAIQRNEKIWENSEKFDPDRFNDEKSKAITDYYMPFAVGRRICLGNNFSIVEGKVVIAQLCSQFNLQLSPSYQFEVEQMATLRPRGGLALKVEKLE
jgi:cytochrome P450